MSPITCWLLNAATPDTVPLAVLDRAAVAALALCAVALIGHAAIWIDAVNRAHSTAMPCGLVRLLTLAGYGLLVGIPLGVAWWFWIEQPPLSTFLDWPRWLLMYGAVSLTVALTAVPWRVAIRTRLRAPQELLSTTRRTADLRHLAEDGAGRGVRQFLRLPGNQAGWLECNEKTLGIRRLAPELDGLVIAHFSDLHFTGRIQRPYYRKVVEAIQEMQPDLVALTGDLVEKAGCLSWPKELLGGLSAVGGKFFILGNHDTRLPLPPLRKAMEDAGFEDLGGRWRRIAIRGTSLILAGNELPWVTPAATLADYVPPAGPRELRILLSHSPDQFPWAVRHDIDLMLAGHTHGGQIQLPVLGPVVAPSLYGVRYASGTFSFPPLVMHVSRGVSSELPLRIRCLPEVTRLVLRCSPHPSPQHWQVRPTTDGN